MTPQFTSDVLEALANAYLALDEKHKKRFFQTVYRTDKKLFRNLQEEADLVKGGNRPHMVAQRPKTYRERLDTALLENENCGPLLSFLRCFFMEGYTALLDGLNDNALKCCLPHDEVVDEFIKTCSNDPFAELFRLTIKHIVSIEYEPDRRPANLSVDEYLGRLENIATYLTGVTDAVRDARLFEYKKAHEKLDEAVKVLTELRSAVEMLTVGTPLEGTLWSNRAELTTVLDHLRQAVTDGKVGKLRGAEELLKSAMIRHKSPKRQKAIRETHSAALAELRDALSLENVPDLPGPKDPESWCRWYLALTGEELEDAQARFSQGGFHKLGELLDDIDVEWFGDFIKENDVGDMPFMTHHEESAGEEAPTAEEDTESGVVIQDADTVKARGVIAVDSESGEGTCLQNASENESDNKGGKELRVESDEPRSPDKSGFARSADLPSNDGNEGTISTSPKGDYSEPNHSGGLVADVVDSPSKQNVRGDFVLGLIRAEEPQVIARRALVDRGPARADALRRLFWNLLDNELYQYVYHLSYTAERVGMGDIGLPPAWISRAVVWGPQCRYTHHEMVMKLQADFSNFVPESLFGTDIPIWSECSRFLVTAGCLSPAIMAPHVNAASVLKELHLGKTPALRELVQGIIDFSARGIPLSPGALTDKSSVAERKLGLEKVSKRAHGWWKGAQNYNIVYRPATHLWRHWLKKGQPIHHLVYTVIDNDLRKLKPLRDYVNRLDIEQTIDQTLRDVFGKTTRLEGTARRQVIRRANEALALVNEWIELAQSMDEYGKGDESSHASGLVRVFAKHYENALAELSEHAEGAGAFVTTVGAAVARRALVRLHEMLYSPSMPTGSRASAGEALSLELYRLPGVIMTDGWELDGESGEPLDMLLSGIGKGAMRWEEAFDEKNAAGDHVATEHIMRYLTRTADSDVVERLESKRDKSIEEWRAALYRHIKHTRGVVSDALNKGQVRYQDCMEHFEAVERLTNKLEGGGDEALLRYDTAKAKLKRVEDKVHAARDTELENTRKRLADMQKILTEEKRERIETLLGQEDVHLANDYMDRVQDGEELPQPEQRTDAIPFLDFYGVIGADGEPTGRFREIQQALERSRNYRQDIIENVKQGRSFGGLDFREVKGSACKQYAKVLTSWFGLKRRRELKTVTQVTDILTGLGMNLLEPPLLKHVGNKTWLSVNAETLRDSPIPQFGSEISGRYTILCHWGRDREDQLVSSFDDSPNQSSGAIIFFFGRLSDSRRRRLAQVCRQRHRTVIVVDDILMTYLAQVRGSKFRVLLECALPYTYTMPYITTASLLPPEMFYGRAKEIEALESTGSNGSCFLYGGRQIGKTVLLKHVRRRFHNPSQGRICKYIDLKFHGIGGGRPMDDIWAVLVEQLRNQHPDLLAGKLPAQVQPEWLLGSIDEWLGADSTRRILVLLDEADLFLQSDGKGGEDTKSDPFSRCSKLKGLMENTERRFKVVFAGLHNVLRSTRVANNPLAHFGQPVCIGPLLGGGESREALRLVRDPLESLGMFFMDEDSDLPIRILAQSNYYPNLIQIYCHNLVTHLMSKSSQAAKGCRVPYFITSEDIDDVYKRQELRDELREKFRLTLDLDKRFSLIAHILALYDSESEDGFTPEAIRSDALVFWEAGFSDGVEDSTGGECRPISLESFRNLLDEMVGLGILRRNASAERYKLRSPNVAALLGTTAQVEGALSEAEGWELPVIYIPETFRAQIDEKDKTLRSPLTAAQEAHLRRPHNTLSLIVGCAAGGIDDVPKALCHSFGVPYTVVADAIGDCNDFRAVLGQLSSRETRGKTVLVVPHTVPWNPHWIKEASKRLKQYKKVNAWAGVVFLADPDTLWEYWDDLFTNNRPDYEMITLHPWKDQAVRQWFEDSSLGPQGPDIRKSVFSLTGNWPLLLREMLDRINGMPNQDALERLRKEMINDRSLRDRLEEAFCVANRPSATVLRLMASYGDPLTNEEIPTLAEEGDRAKSPTFVEKTLAWADNLDLVTQAKGGWRVDLVVARLLLSS